MGQPCLPQSQRTKTATSTKPPQISANGPGGTITLALVRSSVTCCNVFNFIFYQPPVISILLRRFLSRTLVAMPTPRQNMVQLRWISPLISLAALLVLAMLAHHYLQVGSNAVSRPPSSDFYKFYLSGQRLHDGLSMYWLPPPRQIKGDACHRDTPEEARAAAMPPPNRLTLGGNVPCLGPNLNPPIFMAAMLPLSQLPYGQAWWIWAGFSSMCIVLSAWLLSCAPRPHSLRQHGARTLILSALLFAFYPTLANFGLGQLGSLLLLLLTLSWVGLRQGQATLSGVWLGWAIALKPFLGLLLVGLFAAKRWRVAFATTACAALTSLTAGMLFGWTAYLDYLSLASNVSWTATNWNASWIGFVDRAFIHAFTDADFVGLRLSKLVGWSLPALLIVAWLWRLHTLNKASSSLADVTLFSLGIPLALLASPLGWLYYFPTLVLSGLIAWRQPAPPGAQRARTLMIGATCIMAMVPLTLLPTPSVQHPPDWMGMDSWFFFSLCTHLGACCALTRLPPNWAKQKAPEDAFC